MASVTSHVRELLTKVKEGAFKTSKVSRECVRACVETDTVYRTIRTFTLLARRSYPNNLTLEGSTQTLLSSLTPPGLSLQGLSFLDLRYHLLLFYLQDLTHLINIKTGGGKIKDSEALTRVITIRTVRFHNNSTDTVFHHLFALY